MRHIGPTAKTLSGFELQKAQAFAALGEVGVVILTLLVALGILIAKKQKLKNESEISAETARAITNALRAYEVQAAAVEARPA